MVVSKTTTTMRILTPDECKDISLYSLVMDETFQSIRFPKTDDGSRVVALLFAEAHSCDVTDDGHCLVM